MQDKLFKNAFSGSYYSIVQLGKIMVYGMLARITVCGVCSIKQDEE